MADDDQLQVVLVLPGGQFFGLGLIEVGNVDALIACLASLDTRAGHPVSPIDVKRAHASAKALQQARESGANNDDQADGA